MRKIMDELLGDEEVQNCLRHIDEKKTNYLADLVTVNQISAPTFKEGERAEWVLERMKRLDLVDVCFDDVGNVIGRRFGVEGPTTLICAHLDTVFKETTDVSVSIIEDKIIGPGVGDNSLGIAAMLAIAEALQEKDVTFAGDLIFAATVRSQVGGNLLGMRNLMEILANEVDYVLCLHGHRLGRIDHRSIGSVEKNIICRTLGGDSWEDFGASSAINIICEVMRGLMEVSIPKSPKATLNLGLLEAGDSFDSIASEAVLGIEIRSDSGEKLKNLESEVSSIVDRVRERHRASLVIDHIGRQPSGWIEPNHPLVKLVKAVHSCLEIKSRVGTSIVQGSIPLSMGIPTVALGISKGGNLHLKNEFVCSAPICLGIKQVFLTIVGLSLLDR